MSSDTTPSSFSLRSLAPIAPVAVVSAGLLWAFGSTLVELSQAWNNPTYSHGWLVPLFAAFLLWMRRDQFEADKAQPSFWGLLLLAAGLALWLVGTYWHYVWLGPISFIPCVAGVVLIFGGWAGWKWAWPSVMFLAFMVPLPFRLANALSGPLQRLATVCSTFVMQCLGLPALAEGNVILLNDHQIGIVEACSGLRMLVVFFALSTAVVLVINRHWVDRVILLVSAVPIALIANIARVTITGIMYEMDQSDAAFHFYHDLAGWLMMPLALGLLWAELALLNVLFIDAPAEPARPAPSPARKARQAPAPAAPRPPRQRAVTNNRPAAQPQQQAPASGGPAR